MTVAMRASLAGCSGAGQLEGGLQIVRKDAWVPERLAVALRDWSPRSELGRYVREVVAHRLPLEIAEELIDRFSSVVIAESALALVAFRGAESLFGRPLAIEDYGIVGRKVVTDVGVGWIVDVLQNAVDTDTVLQKFHGLGTGTTAESAAHTALVTELTTEYTGNVRATGTTTETSAPVYSTVATNTLDGTPGAALREHGIFSLNAAGVMLDDGIGCETSRLSVSNTRVLPHRIRGEVSCSLGFTSAASNT